MKHSTAKLFLNSKSALFILTCAAASIFVSSPVYAKGTTRDELEVIKQSFLRGDYDRVIELKRNINPEFKDKNTLASYYYAGAALLELGRFEQAEEAFLKIITLRPNISYFDKVEVRLGDAYFEQGEYELALERYRHVIDAYADSPSLPHAYEQAAKTCQKLGQFQEADRYFEFIQKNFPLSFEALRLLRGGTEVSPHFGVQVGSFLDPVNAESVRTDLEAKGFTAYISSARQDGMVLYQVRLGEFASRTEAENLAHQIQALGYSTRVFP